MINEIFSLYDIVLTYCMQLALVSFFLLFSYKILKSKDEQLNLYFSWFFIAIALGSIAMIVYFTLLIVGVFEIILIIFYIISAFFNCYAFGFLYIVNKIIIKSSITFQKSQINNYLKIYAVSLILGMTFAAILDKITFKSGYIVLNIYFFLFIIICVLLISIIPLLRTIKEIYNAMENEKLKEHFRIFYLGVFGLLAIFLSEFLINYLNIELLRIIMNITALSSIICFYLIYKGLIERFK